MKTDAEVLAELRSSRGSRRLRFRFELLDSSNATIDEDLDGVTSCSIEYNALADIKRTAKLTAHASADIDYLSNRLRPWVGLVFPDGEVVEWPQGVFVLSTPKRTLVENSYTTRDVECYDLLQVLGDDKAEHRVTYLKNTLYTTIISSLVLGVGPSDITPSTLRLPADIDFDPGTSKLSILNALLSAINYKTAHFDAAGTFVAAPYVSPADQAPLIEYAADEVSVTRGNIDQTLDLFSVPNKWVLVRSDPDVPELVGTYVNDNPSSPTSTVSRGRTIVDFRTEQDAPDEVTLYAKAERLAFEASQVFEAVEFVTAIMPMHGHADVYSLAFDKLGVASNYSEHTWSFDLVIGGEMKHKARRVVTV